jgi:hypothetical protein
MSSTASLMKRYDAPHMAARMRISGQYPRIRLRLSVGCGQAAPLR